MYHQLYTYTTNTRQDKSPEVRIAACNCLVVLGSYFNTLPNVESALALCVKNIEDPHTAVRTAAATAIGKLCVSACYSVAAPSSVSSVPTPQKSAKKGPTFVWTFDGVAVFFNGLFSKCNRDILGMADVLSGGSKKELRAAISQGYVAFLQEIKTRDLEGNMETLISGVLSLLQFITAKVYHYLHPISHSDCD